MANLATLSAELGGLAPAADEAARRGVASYCRRQAEDGHWPGSYTGPLFLLPGLLIACHLTQTGMTDRQRRRMVTYLTRAQNADGGWGLHVESKSYVVGTVLNYVSMRLLGVEPDDARVAAARRWTRTHGGASAIPSWGKFWLALLGVYRWEGVPPAIPELWLFPSSLPLHPSRLWCHNRMIYLPMSYLFARRVCAPETDLVRALRAELFVEPWDAIDWKVVRRSVSSSDRYVPPSPLAGLLTSVFAVYERHHLARLRERALARVMEHVRYEDESTSYIDLGPVSKPLNMLAVWADNPASPAFQRHVLRIDDYLSDGPDGITMQGYNGSQLWDTAFAMQAILETGLRDEFGEPLRRAYGFVAANQICSELQDRERHYRDPVKGGWPFSTIDHGWPITDCTAEALTAALNAAPGEGGIPRDRLGDAVDFILDRQNRDGGWPTYERARGGRWLERLNPTELFGDTMIDYSYVECTSACIRALANFAAMFPEHRRADVRRAIRRGAAFIRRQQRADGSWFGSWGICFTYGTWFAVEGLVAAGESPAAPCIRRACEFLLRKQRPDGGWGESYLSAAQGQWVEHARSQTVNTAWALLTLLAARSPDREPVERAVRLLLDRQEEDGDWAHDAVAGVFNRTCVIHYDSYRSIMPIWALGRYARLNR